MSTKTELLKLLSDNTGIYLSGQKIGDELQVSRNAIWKAMKQLRDEGYHIESKPSVGYRLKNKSNILTSASVTGDLRHPCDLRVFDTVDSTNNVAKKIPVGNKPVMVIANKQEAGRGRLGRMFASPSGTGLYMTIALRPTFDLNKSLYVTMAVAVAVCRALEKVAGVKVKIKWVIDSLIIGIGVNCFPGSFPEELKDIVGCVSDKKNTFSRGKLAAEIYNQTLEILENLESKSFLGEYRTKCFLLGKNIRVHANLDGTSIKARAIDIDDNGGLVVEYMEGPKMRQIETLTTGEVSVRVEE